MIHYSGSNTYGVNLAAEAPTLTFACRHFSVYGVSSVRCPTCGQLEPQVRPS